MAKYKILATIYVDGERIRRERDAVRELQVMIDDYADNNSESETDISISIKTISKEDK